MILGGSFVMYARNTLNPIEINRISEQSAEGKGFWKRILI